MSGGRIVTIKAYPRVHVTLISMNKNGSRINGGIGFSIKNPAMEVTIIASEDFEIDDQRPNPIDTNQQERLKYKITSLIDDLSLTSNIRITIKGDLPVHSGFGSGTTLRLSCIEGLLILNERTYDEFELVKLSGRGGTSGIGVRTYFKGGYVFDIGHKNVGQQLLPSSNQEVNTKQSLLLSEGPMPNWNLGVCYPKQPFDSAQTEELFFTKHAQVSDIATHKTLYHVVNEVLGGIKEDDSISFGTGVNSIQLCEWKKVERELYADSISDAEKVLYNNGATMVGMSSLGAGLFFWGNDEINIIIMKAKQELADWYFFDTMANNVGRVLTVKDA